MLLLLTSNICRPNHFVLIYLGSTVVKHSTHDLRVEGSNPTTGPGRQKMALNFAEFRSRTKLIMKPKKFVAAAAYKK